MFYLAGGDLGCSFRKSNRQCRLTEHNYTADIGSITNYHQ